jgi:endonuclease I
LINNHIGQGYSALWTFYENHSLDVYFENDGSILDIYSENPTSTESYNFTKVTNQCGNYTGEGGCYNREHTFPKSWFGGKIEPMNSDVHHIYATDGFVNSKRSGFPFGEVATATFTSTNNSKLGSSTTSLGYNGTVFEPIDEFKGDLARAYFYMATRYENVIGSWQNNSVYGDAILDGSSNQVFELWQLEMLKRWHANDPVSQKEIDRNEAAFGHQGNRNPFVDHPEYVDNIWGQ